MRRKERQMEEASAWKCFDESPFLTLSMASKEGEPYAVTLNGVRIGHQIYFHCALQGKKNTMIAANPSVCITAVSAAVNDEVKLTTYYRSAVLFGRIRLVSEKQEKIDALYALCEKYAPQGMQGFDAAMKSLPATAVYCVSVETISGKEHKQDS